MSEGAVTTEIINTYDQLKTALDSGFDKRKAIAISYHAPDRSNSRDISVQQWSVWSPLFQTDPHAHWSDRGAKTFSLHSHGGNGSHKDRKDAALQVAMKWAEERYGVIEWAKNRQGDYVAKKINDRFPVRKRQR
jgi:hypothetical protein